ncbi:hypothetical protein [Tunturiibacter lichenicola]|uniref:hypothetical protein n=1 Tax=Tunturiibacter lichenicola TaxID=2051959 RepID=UPI003D9AD6FA
MIQPRISDRQNTTSTTQLTTFSPSKQHIKTPVFAKPPAKHHNSPPKKKAAQIFNNFLNNELWTAQAFDQIEGGIDVAFIGGILLHGVAG